MAVIQDEQGNNKPIVTDTSHVFDVNGNPLHGELFIGETIASDDVEEIDGFAHESDVTNLNQYLSEMFLVESKSAQVSTTTQQFSVAKDGYTPIGIVGFAIANTAAQINYMLISGTDVSLRATNSTAFYYNVLYVKNLA